MKTRTIFRLTVCVVSALLVYAVPYATSEAQTAPRRMRSYTVNPSSLERGKLNYLTIRSVVCSTNDLDGADLVAPADSGITIEAAVGASPCTMVARIFVAEDAPLDTVSLRVTKEDATLGLVSLTVPGRPADPQPNPTSTKPPAQSPLDIFLPPQGKPETEVPRFETSGQTTTVVSWRKGQIKGDSIWGTEFYYEGMRFRVLTINNVSIAATILHGKKTINLVLIVLNRSSQNIDVVPSRFVLARESPKLKLYAYITPEKLAEKVTREAHRAAFWMALAGAFATRTSTTRSSTTGSLNGSIGSTGSLSGFIGGTYVSGTYIGRSSVSGTYNESTTSTTTQPDYVLRNLYIQRGMERVAQGDHQADEVLNSAFKANTLSPGRFMSGYVYFTRTDSPDLVLQIPIGNYIFALPFNKSVP